MPTPRRPDQHAHHDPLDRFDLEHDASDALPADLPLANVDIPRIERAVREILIAVGEDPDREGLIKTPNRVARAYAELMAGLRADPGAEPTRSTPSRQQTTRSCATGQDR